MPAVKDIAVEFHALDQYQIMVSGKRVGYVCLGQKPGGEDMPINFLSADTIKIKLTDKEKIEISKVVREKMAELNKARDAEASELAQLTNPAAKSTK